MRPLLRHTRVPVSSLHDGAIKRDSSSKKVQPPRNRRALQFALNDPRIMVTADDSPSVINGRAGESIEGIERKRRKPPFFSPLFFSIYSAQSRVQRLGLFSLDNWGKNQTELKGLILHCVFHCWG